MHLNLHNKLASDLSYSNEILLLYNSSFDFRLPTEWTHEPESYYRKILKP